MRFMVMIRADKNAEAGVPPSAELLAEIERFNLELADAGVFLAGEGLHPSSEGARVNFSGGKSTVIDGPFASGLSWWKREPLTRVSCLHWSKPRE
jgi:hypothetical protein